MKNVNVTVDEATWRAARIYAAQHDTSVSALVRESLVRLVAGTEKTLGDTEERQRERLVDLLEECNLSLDGRPSREATYAGSRFH